MKKIILSLGAFLLGLGASAQGPYASLQFGYAMGSSKEVIGSNYSMSGSTSTTTNVYGTYGAGIPITLGLGYNVNDNIGLDLGINYFMGSEQTVSEVSYTGYSSITKVSGYQIRLIPSVVVSSGFSNDFNMYAKAGLMMPVSGVTNFNMVEDMGGIETITEGENHGQFSIGFTGALGANYKLSDNLSLFGELQGINLRVKSGTRTITRYEVGGTDYTSNMTTSQLETEYVDEVSSDDNTDANSPTKALASTANYNSLGLNIGVRFNF